MPEQARLLGEDPPDKPHRKDEEYRQRTKNGYFLDEVTSALQKAIRRANEDAALYWAWELTESGFGQHLWRRLGVIAAEEIGLADPNVYAFLAGVQHLYEQRVKKWSEGPHTPELLGVAILYLCRAPKNKEAGMASGAVAWERSKGRKDPMPDYAVDQHTKAGKEKLKESGVSDEERSLMWWYDWSWCANVKGGNRWLKRCFLQSYELSPEVRQQVYKDFLLLYGEEDGNQL
ncbi:MAG: hypothetical protein HY681_04305 [Chloroflexi bacterium]|nr:hypothetical protein [Chloroflexota bacterium]